MLQYISAVVAVVPVVAVGGGVVDIAVHRFRSAPNENRKFGEKVGTMIREVGRTDPSAVVFRMCATQPGTLRVLFTAKRVFH